MIINLLLEYKLSKLIYYNFPNVYNTIYENIKLLLETNQIDESFAQINKYYSYFVGLYLFEIKQDYLISKKYFKISTKLKNHDPYHMLGHYYQYNEIKKDKMKKYYKKAIKYNKISYLSINNLGLYYYNKKKYNKMKKYYDKNIINNYNITALNYSIYYAYDEKNYKLTKKFLAKVILNPIKNPEIYNIYKRFLKNIYIGFYKTYNYTLL